MKSIRPASKFFLIFMFISLVLAASTRISQAIQEEPGVPDTMTDTYENLIVGIPGEDVPTSGPSIDNAGMVQVIHGSPIGLDSTGNQIFDQNIDFAEDQAEEDDAFGSALASGDFNGDGSYDVAVGIPFENLTIGGDTVLSAGAVQVIYGDGSNGLSISGDQFWHQASPYVEGSAEDNDQFGKVLAVGNFNGDAYDDLAIGIPFEDFEYETTITNAGSVIVIYGSASGLSPTAVLPDQMWHQDRVGIADRVENFDWFGWALASGDFNSDNYADLAIGAPGEDSENASKNDIGVVHVLYGTENGLTADGSQQWEQYDWGGSAESESYDHFGWALAVGKFNGPDSDDLAIGVPDEDIVGPFETITDAGAVNILYGSYSGLSDDHVDFIYQDNANIEEQAEYQDQFGYTLAAVDFNGTGSDKLVVGVPNEDLGSPLAANAGGVHVLTHQFVLGWTGYDNSFFHQGRVNIPDELESYDKFGYALAPGDYNGDGREDLAIGIPYDSCTTTEDGSIIVIYDDTWSNPGQEPQYWCQGDSLLDPSEALDHFGLALTAIPGSDVLIYKTYLPNCVWGND